MPIVSAKPASQMRRAGAAAPVIRLQDVWFRYHAHNGGSPFQMGPLSLDIVKDELLVIVGPSGSGKTTILRLIAGLECAARGRITLNGRAVCGEGPCVPPEHRNVGMVFQEYALFPHLSARDNILFGLARCPKRERIRRLNELEGLLALQGLAGRFPHELSWGQQQRVALARALAPKPLVILLDEPLSHIDADLRAQVAGDLRRVLKATATTAVLVTHDQTEAFDLADRLAVLRDGQLEQVDDPWRVYHMPSSRFVADFIGEGVFLPGRAEGQWIITEVGTFENPTDTWSGALVELLIRPDDVHAEPDACGEGTVMARQFHGSEQLYTIRLPSGRHVLCSEPSTTIWPDGATVRLAVELEHVVVFPCR